MNFKNNASPRERRENIKNYFAVAHVGPNNGFDPSRFKPSHSPEIMAVPDLTYFSTVKGSSRDLSLIPPQTLHRSSPLNTNNPVTIGNLYNFARSTNFERMVQEVLGTNVTVPFKLSCPCVLFHEQCSKRQPKTLFSTIPCSFK